MGVSESGGEEEGLEGVGFYYAWIWLFMLDWRWCGGVGGGGLVEWGIALKK